MPLLPRRDFLKRGSLVAASLPVAHLLGLRAESVRTAGIGQPLPPWQPGLLDIHHISTGRGSCAFLMAPDGTTLMIDAGSVINGLVPEFDQYYIDPLPNDSLRPGQWIARYIARCLPQAGRKEIDCFLLTHLHADHMGTVFPGNTTVSPMSRFGDYQLGGLSDVAEVVPIKRILDRAYPDYNYPVPLDNAQQLNYRAFVKSFASRGGIVERFQPGADKQVVLEQDARRYPNFTVQNLAANGEVWTGFAHQTRHFFPELAELAPADYPTENKCSLALRLSYGKFDYFSAGDMDHETFYNRLGWGDIEAQVARVAGPVEVAVADHHGWVDACGPDWVQALRARVYVINAWDSAHPTMTSLNNMLSTELYPGPRDVFSTAMKPANAIAVRRIAEMKSREGHIVIRVAEGGGSYEVFIRDSRTEEALVTAHFGPYLCT